MSPGVPGGTGTAIDDLVLDAALPLPRLILAGGLTPENVADRIARVRPWMVDVASGVESAPGRKDPGARSPHSSGLSVGRQRRPTMAGRRSPAGASRRPLTRPGVEL